MKTSQLTHLIIVVCALIALSCNNSTSKSRGTSNSNNNNTDNTNPNGPSDPSNFYSITRASVNESANPANIRIFFQQKSGQADFNSRCVETDSGSNCVCRFEWSQSGVSADASQSVNISRADTKLTENSQKFMTNCRLPSVFSSIPKGTPVKVKITAFGSSTTILSNTYIFQVGSSAVINADFYDDSGTPFHNILEYSCYENEKTGTEIINKVDTFTNDSTGDTAIAPMATQFCTKNKDGQTDTDKCPKTISTTNSATSYVHSLYIQSELRGGFNLSNSRFKCFAVDEDLQRNTGVGNQANAYPLSSTFSLAKFASEDFPVGVVAPSVLGIDGDPTTANTSCFPDGSDADASGSSNALSTKCIGFAAKPTKSGSCPNIKISTTNQIVPTTRLRRFIAVYPTTFDTDGRVNPGPKAGTIAYVRDRQVKSNDPSVTYTMLGPKPCVTAILDYEGVTGLSNGSGTVWNNAGGSRPGWVATNSSTMLNIDIDGRHFPNQDKSSTNSCSAMIPLYSYTSSGDPLFASLGTFHSSNTTGGGADRTIDLGGGEVLNMTKGWISHSKPYGPNWIEDEAFQACVPDSSEHIDAPLHVINDSVGNQRYCSENLPTRVRGSFISKLDVPKGSGVATTPVGMLKNFTSHAVKRTTSSTCTATVISDLPTGYPADPANACGADTVGTTAGIARQGTGFQIDNNGGACIGANNACDRTLSSVFTGGVDDHPPLLAEAGDVERYLYSNESTTCFITADNGQGKSWKLSPTDGCCHKDTHTLTPAVGAISASGFNSSNGAHFEPGGCLAPNY